MGLGEAWWFWEPNPDQTYRDPLRALTSGGLMPRHPASDKAFFIDEVRGRVEMDDRALLDDWNRGAPIVAQLWLNDETDVLVTIERSQRLITVDLDGATEAEGRTVVFLALGAALASDGTYGFVADRDLPDQGEAWAHHFGGGGGQADRGADLYVRRHPGGGMGDFAVTVPSWSWLRS